MIRSEITNALAKVREVLLRCESEIADSDQELASEIEHATELIDEVIEPAALAVRYPK